MPKPSKPNQPLSFAEITAQTVRDSPHPILFDEIMYRVHAVRPINTNSPKGTLRSALSQNRLIAPDGLGNYGWSPHMMDGARVRVALVQEDLQHQTPHIEFDDDVRELLWPGFFAIQKYSDRNPVQLVRRNPDVVRAADAAFISDARYAQVKSASYLDVAPELVVEVMSPADTWSEVKEKLRDYFAAGVLLAWIVDPATETITAYNADGTVQEFIAESTLTAESVLPGFAVRVADIFE